MLIERLDRIESNLDDVRKHLQSHPSCPNPGMCLQLNQAHTQTMARVEKLELRILAIEKWQSWLMGVAALLMLLATVFGPPLRKLLKLE
jgi:hypothetical protein